VTVLGRVGRAPALALWVDPKVHAAEVARVSQQDRGRTGDRDCSIWIGSIGADGCQPVRRDGGPRIMVRANRYALAAALGRTALAPTQRALQGCNKPACVRVSRPRDTGLLHIVSGSQRHNMEMMARAGPGGGCPRVLRGRAGLGRRRGGGGVVGQ
jgi:hypothetical protein